MFMKTNLLTYKKEGENIMMMMNDCLALISPSLSVPKFKLKIFCLKLISVLILMSCACFCISR